MQNHGIPRYPRKFGRGRAFRCKVAGKRGQTFAVFYKNLTIRDFQSSVYLSYNLRYA
ncbi:MAG: hypothetical protein LBQ31_02520 [Bacteroidales bacterium]|nr:hypothetical protein [Bacteroidales bacterium]